jgi:hypothetical protein
MIRGVGFNILGTDVIKKCYRNFAERICKGLRIGRDIFLAAGSTTTSFFVSGLSQLGLQAILVNEPVAVVNSTTYNNMSTGWIFLEFVFMVNN